MNNVSETKKANVVEVGGITTDDCDNVQIKYLYAILPGFNSAAEINATRIKRGVDLGRVELTAFG